VAQASFPPAGRQHLQRKCLSGNCRNEVHVLIGGNRTIDHDSGKPLRLEFTVNSGAFNPFHKFRRRLPRFKV